MHKACPVFRTAKEARAAAAASGWKLEHKLGHKGAQVFYDKKTKMYYSRDVDGHNGGAWKGAKKPEDLFKKETRSGTYDKDGNRIGD